MESVVVVVSSLIALMKNQVESFKREGLETASLVLDVAFVLLMQLPTLLGELTRFNNEIHHDGWYRLCQTLPTLGLGLACKTPLSPIVHRIID